MYTICRYTPALENSWLRCRLLSFFASEYYDDVLTARPIPQNPSVALVAIETTTDGTESSPDRRGGASVDTEVVGLVEVEYVGGAATIENIAVHPDHQGQGIATALLAAAVAELPESVATIDAWTRSDEAANAWYQANGFVENFCYLHIYLSQDEDPQGFTSPAGLSAPVTAFAHADLEHEAEMRSRFARVYRCRQYLRVLRSE